MAKLEIIIINYRIPDITSDCLRSIYKNPPRCSYTIWLADNGSKDGSIERIGKDFPKVKLIDNKENIGFARGNNVLIKKAIKKGKYFLLLNSDTIVLPGALQTLVDFADKSDYGIISCKTIFPDKSFQPNTGSLPKIYPLLLWLSGIDDLLKKFMIVPTYHQENKKFYVGEKEVGWISGSVFLIKKQVIEKIGLLDERIFMYGEDVEYCWRANRAGFKIGWTDSGKIIHIGGATFSTPKYKQWTGEFKGLFYLYRKQYGLIPSFLLRLLCYPFIILRALAFLLIGKTEHAKTYAKVIISI